MNKKDLYLFNSVKSLQFLNSFRPTSTPFNEHSSPGLSNINIHSFLVKSHFNSSNTVYQKNTKEENKKTEFVQEGKGVEEDDFELFDKPIKVSRTLLNSTDKTSNDVDDKQSDEQKIDVQEGSSKRKSKQQNKSISKKPKMSFKIVD
jgi:hypothetical protein